MAAQRHRQRVVVDDFEQHPAVVGVIVLELRQAQDGRPDVGVVGKHSVGQAELADAGADDTEPGAHDLALEVAVVDVLCVWLCVRGYCERSQASRELLPLGVSFFAKL